VNARREELKSVEAIRLTTLTMEENLYSNMIKEVPEMFGLNQEQIDAIPPFIRHFRCQDQTDQTENGNPTCETEKYSKDICPKRAKQAAWHPGCMPFLEI
jgi:hypothetical protein